MRRAILAKVGVKIWVGIKNQQLRFIYRREAAQINKTSLKDQLLYSQADFDFYNT